jgi:release factor glutamine methyltransferase
LFKNYARINGRSEQVNVSEGLRGARTRLQGVSESASSDAQRLLGHVLAVDRAYLLAYPETELSPEQAARFEALVARAEAGEPLPYLLGHWPFYDREFIVTPAVLIPRPETELLLEQALAYVAEKPNAVVVDVGTGSGALAVTLAALRPAAQVYAVDISPAALAVARQNAGLHHTMITFSNGDLLIPILERGLKADVIMANLPYIARGEVSTLTVSRYEPHLALDGGPDGLDLVRRLLADAPRAVKDEALLLLEIGWEQGESARQIAQGAFPNAAIDVLKDYAGLDRIVRIHIAR